MYNMYVYMYICMNVILLITYIILIILINDNIFYSIFWLKALFTLSFTKIMLIKHWKIEKIVLL